MFVHSDHCFEKNREAVEKHKMTAKIVEKNDLARLAEVRQRREEAAKRREEEQKGWFVV